jgi:hypothetical protein
MLELKPATDDQHTLKTNVLPGENDVLQSNIIKYIQKQSYRQPCYVQSNLVLYNMRVMHNTQHQIEIIIHSPQLTPDDNKSELDSNELNRFQEF